MPTEDVLGRAALYRVNNGQVNQLSIEDILEDGKVVTRTWWGGVTGPGITFVGLCAAAEYTWVAGELELVEVSLYDEGGSVLISCPFRFSTSDVAGRKVLRMDASAVPAGFPLTAWDLLGGPLYASPAPAVMASEPLPPLPRVAAPEPPAPAEPAPEPPPAPKVNLLLRLWRRLWA